MRGRNPSFDFLLCLQQVKKWCGGGLLWWIKPILVFSLAQNEQLSIEVFRLLWLGMQLSPWSCFVWLSGPGLLYQIHLGEDRVRSSNWWTRTTVETKSWLMVLLVLDWLTFHRFSDHSESVYRKNWFYYIQ